MVTHRKQISGWPILRSTCSCCCSCPHYPTRAHTSITSTTEDESISGQTAKVAGALLLSPPPICSWRPNWVIRPRDSVRDGVVGDVAPNGSHFDAVWTKERAVNAASRSQVRSLSKSHHNRASSKPSPAVSSVVELEEMNTSFAPSNPMRAHRFAIKAVVLSSCFLA